jgi:Fe-S oxidoreductase
MKQDETTNNKKPNNNQQILREKKWFEKPMNKEIEVDDGTIPTQTLLQRKVCDYLRRCIECNKCMEACPATKDAFSIQQLNDATTEGHPIPPNIRRFTFHCMQCGKCIPVCPKDIHRDEMMLLLKHRLKEKKPWGYRRYLLVKGAKKQGFNRVIQRLYIRFEKLMNKDLASLMENTPRKNAEVLFYPGCYIYSTKTIRQTLRLLDHIGCSYTVMGGVTTCCGAPHLLQGEFDQADHCRLLLYQKIHACNPTIIITACAECFEVIEQIKKTYHLDVEVLSVAQYLLRYQHLFPAGKIREKTLIHDSCRFSAQSPQGKAARESAALFAQLIYPPEGFSASCCFQWNHGSDKNNIRRQTEYLASVQNRASTLACTCLTCYEELRKRNTDIDIIDILSLFEESLDVTKKKEDQG